MELDPRGQRFAASITSVVIILVLVTRSPWLALAQTAVFALTATNPRRGPYALLFRQFVLPHIGPPAEREPAAPVRFAQTVGLAFLGAATIAFFAGAPVVGLIFAGLGLVAAFLNAAFGLCLGCEAYLALRRLTAARNSAA
ncbi:DUF4395 domain-containing protein [Actinoplanes sp. NPDC089786]|uniref:DUF4395 domain-containing protein n=1 Tax=Actinoplanes sp. NPDC089786 TaxID=3155185 RepID=UPI003420BA15